MRHLTNSPTCRGVTWIDTARAKDIERRLNEYACQLQRELREFRELLLNEERVRRKERR
jgi:hypothetical protein